jgi:predicted SnoaL-like aldol condensation-catalyzing enzyme
MAGDRKAMALEFLRRARAGDRAGAEQMVTAGARHHNPYFKAGMSTLLHAIVAASQAMPESTFDAKHVVSEGDYVVIHSHVRHKPNDTGIAVVHILRFEGDRIAEFWDIGQQIPADNPNADGMF